MVLSERQVLLAHNMRNQGFTYREIAQTFGCSDRQVNYRINGRCGEEPRRLMTDDGIDPWFEAASLGMTWERAKVYVTEVLHGRRAAA